VLVRVQQLDPTFSVLREGFLRAGREPPPTPPFEVAVLMALPAFLIAPLINTLVAIGEEVGWRGYLWARWQPLGPRRAALAIGVIWGVWHAPIIVQGHNYPGEPLLGPLLMVVLTVAYGVILAWLRARSGSVWPAALAHGALNAEGGAVAVFLTPADRLVGAPIGIVALIPALLVALALLRFGRWEAPDEVR
jgi:membrane protease YdiL (CAAX protease family)